MPGLFLLIGGVDGTILTHILARYLLPSVFCLRMGFLVLNHECASVSLTVIDCFSSLHLVCDVIRLTVPLSRGYFS